MINEIQNLLNQYIVWLKDKTEVRQVRNWVEITTPYLDRHNDHLQIYVKKDNGGFILTDDGYIINDLMISGCKLDSEKRQKLLKMTLNGFGVQLDSNNAIIVHTSGDNFASRKHNLIQAMLAVNDLFYLASPIVADVFLEDVALWLDMYDVRYTQGVKFTGKSGYDHVFDFVIPKSRKQPERIIRTINRPNRNNVEALAFAWVDTREVRHPESRAYAFLNDTDRAPSDSIIDAFRSYDVLPMLWSQREKFKDELAA
jgi:hypothetical protein